MADKICTNFIDDDGLDVGCHLIPKEYVLENYPHLVPWMKTPALWVWGNGTFGEIGDDQRVSRSSPVQTISGGTDWKSVSAGAFVNAAIKADGSLWLWGTNIYGQLGDNSTVNSSSPVQTVSAGTDWKKASAGFYHIAAIKTDGSLWSWGYNIYGQLGNNSTIPESSPIQTISNVNTWKQVSTSSRHTVAIKTDGTLWLWGAGVSGLLGNNSTIPRSSPVQTVSNVTTWKKAYASGLNTVAIKTDGTLWSWGENFRGQLGNNSVIFASSPVQTVSNVTTWKNVSAGNYFTTAIKTDGTLWSWGYNLGGNLGDNTVIGRSSPVQTVSGGTNWFSVCSCQSTAAIKTDGTLWVWGVGSYGTLGNNTNGAVSSPIQTIAGGSGWKNASVGFSVLAIRDEGDF